MSTVGVVVVTSDSAYCIEKCLTSIRAAKSDVAEIVVVDNDSQDGTQTIIHKFEDFVHLVQRQGRHSLSNNLNVALKSAVSDYVLVLNPDIVLPMGSVKAMAQYLDAHHDCGACAPALQFPDGRLQLSCRRFPTVRSVVLRRTPLRLFLSETKRGSRHLMANGDHSKVQDVDWVLGACVMFRRTALHSIGYFDEGFRLYCEDIDICHRLWRDGWTVRYNPEIRVVHEHRAVSDRQFFSQHSIWHFKSMFHYARKHGIAGQFRPRAQLIRKRANAPARIPMEPG